MSSGTQKNIVSDGVKIRTEAKTTIFKTAKSRTKMKYLIQTKLEIKILWFKDMEKSI